jgi:Flp pilus assembly protein protease CpaA
VISIASLSILKFALAAVVSAVAVTEDIRNRQIPNPLSTALLLIGILSAAFSRGWTGLADGVLGAALAFAVFLIPYLCGGMGGGDVKLMAGFGALIGAQSVLPALLLVAAAGAATSALFLIYRWLRGQAIRGAIPYAPAIVIGSLLVAASQIGAR